MKIYTDLTNDNNVQDLIPEDILESSDSSLEPADQTPESLDQTPEPAEQVKRNVTSGSIVKCIFLVRAMSTVFKVIDCQLMGMLAETLKEESKHGKFTGELNQFLKDHDIEVSPRMVKVYRDAYLKAIAQNPRHQENLEVLCLHFENGGTFQDIPESLHEALVKGLLKLRGSRIPYLSQFKKEQGLKGDDVSLGDETAPGEDDQGSSDAGSSSVNSATLQAPVTPPPPPPAEKVIRQRINRSVSVVLKACLKDPRLANKLQALSPNPIHPAKKLSPQDAYKNLEKYLRVCNFLLRRR